MAGIRLKKYFATEKTKKPESAWSRFGLFRPTSDWQYWQSTSKNFGNDFSLRRILFLPAQIFY
jgi:hypothetical protein